MVEGSADGDNWTMSERPAASGVSLTALCRYLSILALLLALTACRKPQENHTTYKSAAMWIKAGWSVDTMCPDNFGTSQRQTQPPPVATTWFETRPLERLLNDLMRFELTDERVARYQSFMKWYMKELFEC